MDSIDFYLHAKNVIIDSGYENELAWVESLDPDKVTKKQLMAETAWVILNSGMRASVIDGLAHKIELAFMHWDVDQIIRWGSFCVEDAMEVFGHKLKINAILSAAKLIDKFGIDYFISGVRERGPEFLIFIPFIGKITCHHLAKNLGFPTAKPDRHLVRVANAFDNDSVQNFCAEIAGKTDDTIPTIDMVLWRYCTIDTDYLNTLREKIVS